MSRPLHLCEILEEEHAALYPTDRRHPHSWDVGEEQIQDAIALSARCKKAFKRDFSDQPQALAGELTQLVQCVDVLTRQYTGLLKTLSKALRQVIDDNKDARGEEVQHLNRLIIDEVGEDAITPGPRARLETFVGMVHEKHRSNENTYALCISGGGIRSATFALGVLQSLARRNLLDKFDFISTVSGGGYIGSWLSSWIRRHRDGVRGVADELSQTPADPLQPQPPPVMHLREYSNYLTPRLGLMSGDTWAVIATYFRNLLLNWTILIPAMLVLVLLPRLAAAIDFSHWLRPFSERVFTSPMTRFIRDSPELETAGYASIGALLLVIGLVYIGWNRPADNRYHGRRSTSDKSFVLFCLVPLIVGATILTSAWVCYTEYRGTNHKPTYYPPVAGWIIFLMPLVILAVHLFNFFRVDAAARRMNIAAEVRHGKVARTAKKISYEVFAAVVAGYLSHQMLRYLAMNVFSTPFSMEGHARPLYVTFAVPCVLAALYLAASIFVGLSSEVNEDWDREWWARCGGWVLAAIVAWPLLSGVVIFGPALFRWRPEYVVPAGTIVSIVTVLLGRSSKTGQSQGDERSPLVDLAARALAPAAILFIFATLSLGTSTVLGKIWGIAHRTKEVDYHTTVICESTLSHLLIALGAVLLVATVAGALIGVNQASMHSMYRNRLIRAYLGASRGTRDPNPFTGFDPHDNLTLQLLRPELLWLTSFIDFPAFYQELRHSNHPFVRNLRAAIDQRRQGILSSNTEDESVREGLFQVLNCVMEEENFREFLKEPPEATKKSAVETFRAAVDRIVRFIARERPLKSRLPHLLRHNRRLLEKHFPARIYPYRAPLLRRGDVRDPGLLKHALKETAFGKRLVEQMRRVDPCDWDSVLGKLWQPDDLKRVTDVLNVLLTSICFKSLKEGKFETLPQPVDYQRVCRNRRILSAELTLPNDIVRPDDGKTAGQPVLHDTALPRPMHIINAALNLVAGNNLAWQERKADTFTFSPLHSGSYRLGYRSTVEYGGDTGLTLGTAMTISGAAASPNMGYHSSAPLAFLMTLFNVRLGWWLGNPGVHGRRSFRHSSPLNALGLLVVEAMGKTSDEYAYVYLSDGGHFENLGLYEMVLRRRRFILVIDAGCDPLHKFDDLGNAIRKIRTDFGIPIEMQEPMYIYPRGVEEPGGKYCAIGKIRYSCVDGDRAPDGSLLYIKPAVYLNEPRDIYNYATRNIAFPHETTANQFFTESQFESYRMLGSHVIDDIVVKAKETLKKAQKGKHASAGDSLESRIFDCDPETWTPRSVEEFFDLANKFYIGASAAAEAGRKVAVQHGSRVTLTIRPQREGRPPLHTP